MNTLKNIMGLFLVAFLLFSCKNETKSEVKTIEAESAAQTEKTVDTNATYAKAEFTIDGMTCPMGCAKTIERKIAGMEGVKSAAVDFDRKLAMVEYDVAKVSPISITETVAKAGDMYTVKDMKTVEAFLTNKSGALKCSPNCTKKDCPDCMAKAEACKANCANKTEAEKMACAKEGQKSCCMNKTKA